MFLPITILIIMGAWHLFAVYYYETGGMENNIIITALAIFICYIGINLRQFPKQDAFLNPILEKNRTKLGGLAVILIVSIHLIFFSKIENVMLIILYTGLILAYIESSGIAISHRRYLDMPAVNESTSESLSKTYKHIGLVLTMTVIGSIVTLYLSLLAIVGFRSTWSAMTFAIVAIVCFAILIRTRAV